MDKNPAVYIMGNTRPTLYIGVTSNLNKRVYEHKSGKIKGFTFKYKLFKLLYFEFYPKMGEAIAREKQIKNWHREWKLKLIKKKNPQMVDLFVRLKLKNELGDPEINSG